MNSIFDCLNPPQLEAVQHTDGPLLILAGAGSGKTRTITYRIWYLIEQMGISPWYILAVTFTNKAASEMRTRIQALLQASDQSNVWVSTFHSACVRILRQHCSSLGINSAFAILDAGDQLSVVKKCIQKVDDHPQSLNPYAVLEEMRKAKNNLLSAQEYSRSSQGDFFRSRAAQVFKAYEETLKESAALDFDDLLLYTIKLFKEYPDVLDHYQNRFHYIMVDEYQDTNHAQSELIYLLAGKYQNICVVGDDDQSIYRWRGADIHNILDFEKVFPETKVIRLEQNYRSTKNILKAAHEVISHNSMRKGKELWTSNEDGANLLIQEAYDEQQEAVYVRKAIQSMCQSEFTNYRNYAVLFRTNAQSRALEEALRNEGIPYVVVGGLKFYERREIKDLIAYLKVIANPDHQLSLFRIINTPPRKLGTTTLARIESYAAEHHFSAYRAMEAIAETEELKSGQRESLKSFLHSVQKWQDLSQEKSIADLLEGIIKDINYYGYLTEDGTEDAEARVENVHELISGIQYFEQHNPGSHLADFLDYVSLLSDIDEYNETSGAVTLMTVHSAKGLEFPVVFMVGMEENLFPVSRSLNSPESVEEERRLCYVGMTRAQKRLIFTHARYRSLYGNTQHNALSRFLQEIPADLFEDPRKKPAPPESNDDLEEMKDKIWAMKKMRQGKERETHSSPPLSQVVRKIDNSHQQSGGTTQELRVGDRVYHEQWGEGLILYREGEGESCKISITFGGLKKKLVLKYAKLTKI